MNEREKRKKEDDRSKMSINMLINPNMNATTRK